MPTTNDYCKSNSYTLVVGVVGVVGYSRQFAFMRYIFIIIKKELNYILI